MNVFAKQGSPVIAVNDGRIVKLGRGDPKLGNYVELQDATGNVYTYAGLGSVPAQYPVPKPVKLSARQLAQELSAPVSVKAPKVSSPATAGSQQAAATATPSQATKATTTTRAAKAAKAGPISLPVTPAPTQPANTNTNTNTNTSTSSAGAANTATAASAETGAVSAPLAKERLFADPRRPASYAAGGKLQIQNTQSQISSFENYFSDVLHLNKNQYTLAPLKVGAVVVAGTILGRLAAGTPKLASHLLFMIRPAGAGAPQIDPKPILDGWKLLEATAVYRAAGVDPFFGPGAKNATIGQILLMSKTQLTNRVLTDPHLQIYACGRRDIQAGLIDRRILADIEFLSASSLYPTISGLDCGHTPTGQNGIDPAGATGNSMDISQSTTSPSPATNNQARSPTSPSAASSPSKPHSNQTKSSAPSATKANPPPSPSPTTKTASKSPTPPTTAPTTNSPNKSKASSNPANGSN